MAKKLKQGVLRPGDVVHVSGIPLVLAGQVIAETHPSNWPAVRQTLREPTLSAAYIIVPAELCEALSKASPLHTDRDEMGATCGHCGVWASFDESGNAPVEHLDDCVWTRLHGILDAGTKE